MWLRKAGPPSPHPDGAVASHRTDLRVLAAARLAARRRAASAGGTARLGPLAGVACKRGPALLARRPEGRQRVGVLRQETAGQKHGLDARPSRLGAMRRKTLGMSPHPLCGRRTRRRCPTPRGTRRRWPWCRACAAWPCRPCPAGRSTHTARTQHAPSTRSSTSVTGRAAWFPAKRLHRPAACLVAVVAGN